MRGSPIWSDSKPNIRSAFTGNSKPCLIAKRNDDRAEPGIIETCMIEAVGVTDPGCVRANNEDYFLIAPEIGLYLVADGMGGAQAGEHASKMAVETVREVLT